VSARRVALLQLRDNWIAGAQGTPKLCDPARTGLRQCAPRDQPARTERYNDTG